MTTGIDPQPLEQQRGTDVAHRDRGGLAAPGRVEHHRLLHKARARAQQSIELSAGFEFIQPSKGSDHALAHLIAGALALHDLQVDASLRLFAAKVHARLARGAHRLPQITTRSIKTVTATWHYMFSNFVYQTQ